MRDASRTLRTTLRSLARQPGLTLAVIVTLALGIGAATALFAYLAAILWPGIDAPDAGRAVWLSIGSREEPQLPVSYPDFLDLRQRQGAVRDLIGFANVGASVGHGREGRESTFAWGLLVSGDFFSFFGARPELGRLLQPADDRPGAEPVLVVSHRFWQETLGGDPSAVGRPLRINGGTFLLVGVTAKGFQGTGRPTPLYLPLAQSDRVTGTPRLDKRELAFLGVLGRRTGSLAAARATLDTLGRALDAAAPRSGGPRRVTILPVTSPDPTIADDPFFVAARLLLGAALLFLLLGCANVANLLLARATARQREWGIRAALGAARWRLARAVLAESLALGLAGGALGLLFAAGMAHRMQAYLTTSPGGLGTWSEDADVVRLDVKVYAFALLAALLCAALCGLAPALRALRGDLVAPIKSDAAGAVGAAGLGGALVPRRLLVVAQVALAVVLLLGGGLLTRTLRQAESVDPGFDARRLLLVTLYVPRNVTPKVTEIGALYRRILDRVRALPGVEAASHSYNPPLVGYHLDTRVASRERPGQPTAAGYNLVSAGYFAALGIPIVAGRPLDDRDGHAAPPVAVVSRVLARKLWGEESPLGRTLTLSDAPRPGELGPTFEVVGVTADVRIDSLTDPPGPRIYFSFAQRSHPRETLVVRTAASPAALAPVLRAAVGAAHPDVSIVDLMPLDEQVRRSLFQRRMHAEIAGLFGVLGLLVAAVGLFGLLSYTVSQRTREIGIRMAVGAGRRDVLRLVLGQGMALVGIGLAVGLAASLLLTPLLARLLFGVAVADPLTFLTVPALLLAVAFLACWLPARRAARLDPLAALRRS
jgi:putative ABC transport system permease protein